MQYNKAKPDLKFACQIPKHKSLFSGSSPHSTPPVSPRLFKLDDVGRVILGMWIHSFGAVVLEFESPVGTYSASLPSVALGSEAKV